MNKKHLLFLPCGILAGLLTGYLVSDSSSGSTATSILEHKGKQPSRPPRFGEQTTGNTNKSASSDPAFGSREEEFMDSLFRYSRMPVEELSGEWKKLSSHYNYNDDFTNAKLYYIAKKWGELTPRQAILTLKENDGENFIPSIMQDWLQRDPQTALAYILDHKNDYDPEHMVQVLAPHAPSAVLEWIETLPKDKREICYITAEHDIPADKMPALVSSLKKSEIFPNDFECNVIAQKWATVDWETASEWINSLDHLEKEKRMKVIENALSALPPEKALSELEKRSDVNKDSVLLALAERIAGESPSKALDWFIAHASEQQIEQTLKDDNNTFFLNAYDPDLVNHAIQLPPGAMKDAILAKMSYRIFIDDKGGAEYSINSPSLEKRLELISQIGNPENRQKALYNFLSQYIHYKPQKVLQQLGNSDLTPQQKEILAHECKRSLENDPMPYP